MSIDLTPLATATKLLITAPLRPVQGRRFQPTGFPDLGAAIYDAGDQRYLLVESPQSMANRLENVCWDAATNELVPALHGLAYVRVERDGKYLTSSITEAHRLNSPYILEGTDKTFFERLREAFGVMEGGPIDRPLLSKTLFQYDTASLIHGIFLAKPALAGGRLRVARALSSFIEAEDVKIAASGGVKNDHVNPSGDTAAGFGNVPFHREEFTAARISAYFNLDLAQIRGYGLSKPATDLLILVALYKIRALLDGDLRLRTACDLSLDPDQPIRLTPPGFTLPTLDQISAALAPALAACKAELAGTTIVHYNDPIGKTTKADKADKAKGKGKGN
jgi:CRISPR-associated protein Csb1